MEVYVEECVSRVGVGIKGLGCRDGKVLGGLG